ncbi:hypothetical protein [Thalassobaculum sp.]
MEVSGSTAAKAAAGLNRALSPPPGDIGRFRLVPSDIVHAS